MLDEYMKLHDKLLTELAAYHNAHVKLMSSRNGREPRIAIKQIVREIRKTAKAIQVEMLRVDKLKLESVKHQYQSMRKNKNG